MKRIFKNFIFNATYQVLLILIPLITTPYLSRIFGPDRMGIYSYEFTVSSFFALFGVLGINNYGNRRIAEVRDNIEERSKAFIEIYVMQIIFSICTVLLYLGYAFFFSRYTNVSVILIFHVLSTLFDINWFFWGLEKFKLTVTRNIIIKLSSVALILLLVKNDNDLSIYTWIMSLSNLVSHLVIWPFLKGEIRIAKNTQLKWNRHLKDCVILFVPILAQYLYKNMDKVMIELLNSTSQVGLYTNADKIAVMPVGIITAVGVVMLPVMSRLFSSENREKVEEILKFSMLFTNILSIGMSFGLAAISSDLVPIFLGEKYLECDQLLVYLSSLIFFMAWSNAISTQYLIPAHRDYIYVKAVFIGVVTNLIVNYALIGHYGAAGAAAGTIIAELSVMLYLCLKLHNDIPIKSFISSMIPFLVFGILMLIGIKMFAQIIPMTNFKFALEIIIGIIIYTALSMIYLSIFRKDVATKIYSAIRH